MESFRNAVGYRHVGFPASALSLSQGLRCRVPRPISLKHLIENLAPETKVFDTWNFDGGHITGWTQLAVQSDGTGSFRGHFHDSGPTGYNYVVATVLLDVKDQSGNTLVFAHSGSVHGTFDIGDRDDDWQDDSFNCVIAQNWDTVKTSRVQHVIHTSNDVLDTIEHVVAGMLLGLGIAGFVIFGVGIATGTIVCDWGLLLFRDGKGQPGIGALWA